MAHSVRRHLGVEITAYDETIRRFIPGYEEMLRLAADAVVAAHPALILDLGAGTGALSEAVLDREGEHKVELLDVDPEMLAKARERLARFGERVRYREGSFARALPACDAAMASLALHHVSTLEEKAELYARVAAALPAGGVFVNADAVVPREAEARHAAFRIWAGHQVASGISEERAWANFEEWALEDTYFSLEEETGALTAAGLEPGVLWSRGPMTVMACRKP